MPNNYEDSVRQAAELLSQARLPVVAGLQADIAGIVAAIRLAQRIGGVIDHAAAQSILNHHSILQDIGLMFVTPPVARRSADTLLLLGHRPLWTELEDSGSHGTGADPQPWERLRQIVSLGHTVTLEMPGPDTWSPALSSSNVAAFLAAIRARINGRPLAAGFDATEVNRCVELLASANFGVAVWHSGELSPLEVEMLTGMVKDLNAATRWSSLPLPADPTALATASALGWMAGLPIRTAFIGDNPQHDAWRFDAERLITSGEADAVVWISALGGAMPGWCERARTVLLTTSGTPNANTPISFMVGRPGFDHDGVLYDPAVGTLTERRADSPGGLPAVAAVLNDIREALPAP